MFLRNLRVDGAEILWSPGSKLGEEGEFRFQLYANHKMRLKIFHEWTKGHFNFMKYLC